MTDFGVILPCVPTWTYIQRCLHSILQRGRGRFAARNCSHWTFQRPWKVTVAMQKSSTTSFSQLVLHHGLGKLTGRLAYQASPLDLILLFYKKKLWYFNRTKKVQWEHCFSPSYHVQYSDTEYLALKIINYLDRPMCLILKRLVDV